MADTLKLYRILSRFEARHQLFLPSGAQAPAGKKAEEVVIGVTDFSQWLGVNVRYGNGGLAGHPEAEKAIAAADVAREEDIRGLAAQLLIEVIEEVRDMPASPPMPRGRAARDPEPAPEPEAAPTS